MRPTYLALAIFLGLVGLAAIELAGTLTGTLTAMTPSVALDAAAYALGTLLLAMLFAPAFRRARGIAAAGVVLLFLLAYAPVVAVIGAALDLTASGAWGHPSIVRGAFITTPVNLIATFVLELPYVALPFGVVSALLLWRQARTGTAPGRPRTAST